MDKCHPFLWANSLGKHLIRLPAEGQLPMVVTYSIRHPRIAFPSFCVSFPSLLLPGIISQINYLYASLWLSSALGESKLRPRVKCLTQCLAHGEPYLRTSYYYFARE